MYVEQKELKSRLQHESPKGKKMMPERFSG